MQALKSLIEYSLGCKKNKEKSRLFEFSDKNTYHSLQKIIWKEKSYNQLLMFLLWIQNTSTK